MKTKLLITFLCISLSFYAQEKYYTKSGKITFESSVPSFEEVKATNNKVSAILKDDGAIASLALVKAFRFKIALMEEHFNENYAESSIYPKATFKGNIVGANLKDGKSGAYTIAGDLTFHGVTQSIQSIPIEITFEEDAIIIKGNFTVKASEYDIKIPNIVKNKVSETVIISFVFNLDKS